METDRLPAHRLLIVTPHFPPTSAPDMQRVRLSLPHFARFGWTPYVLAVAPTETEVCDPMLAHTLPPEVPVERVRSLPVSLTRLVGVGNLALRALPFLHAAGRRLIATHHIDLVYFSTTAFFSMPLGRLWKQEFHTPFVLDFQDPWLSDYYETHPDAQPPPKYWLARRVHRVLEPWTLRRTDGIVSVSPDYVETLCDRYPWMRDAPAVTVPFGAARDDFATLDRHPQPNRHFSTGDGRVHGVYAGRGGDDLSTALDILFRALRAGLDSAPDVFGPVTLHFVGTDYATNGRARRTIGPVAERAGVGIHVVEDTARLPYFEALQLVKDADFLVVVGSDDQAYTASKIYPYILANKPLLAVVHERSTVVDVLRRTGAGVAITFSASATEQDKAAAAKRLAGRWCEMLTTRSPRPVTDWTEFERYTAREMTRRQCDLFDAVLARRAAKIA